VSCAPEPSLVSNSSPALQLIAPDVKLGKGVRCFGFVNLYGCEIGDEVKNRDVRRNRKRAQGSSSAARFPVTHSICEELPSKTKSLSDMGDFTNDRYPRSTDGEGGCRRKGLAMASPPWSNVAPPSVPEPLSLRHSTIRRARHCRRRQCRNQDVPAGTILAGNPARVIRRVPGQPKRRSDVVDGSPV